MVVSIGISVRLIAILLDAKAVPSELQDILIDGPARLHSAHGGNPQLRSPQGNKKAVISGPRTVKRIWIILGSRARQVTVRRASACQCRRYLR